MGCLEDVFGMYMVYIHVYKGGGHRCDYYNNYGICLNEGVCNGHE